MFLSNEEVESFKYIIESGILSFFDSLYLRWIESIPEHHETYPKKGKYDLIYGGIVDGKEVAYTAFAEVEKIATICETLKNIPIPQLRDGLQGTMLLIEAQNSTYKDWVELEGNTELELWKQKDMHVSYV